jgi:hypothetical protein
MNKDKKKAPAIKKPIPKLFSDDRNSAVLKAINGVYKFFFIVKKFTGSLLWYSSFGKYDLPFSGYSVPPSDLNFDDERLEYDCRTDYNEIDEWKHLIRRNYRVQQVLNCHVVPYYLSS